MIHTTHVPDLVTAEWMSKTQLLAGCARTDGSWLITPSPLYSTLPLTSTPLVVRCDLQAGWWGDKVGGQGRVVGGQIGKLRLFLGTISRGSVHYRTKLMVVILIRSIP